MKNKNIVWYGSFFVTILAASIITSCNKKFDEPPLDTNPGVTANTTIKQLRALSTGYGVFNLITTDIIITGTVVGNDKSGNIYKEIYLQDSTAGIAVQLDATGLYNSYPIGREIFILCKGLYIANESGMLKLCVRAVSNGSASVSGIPSGIIDNYVKRGKINAPLAPKVVTVSQLNNDFQSMLIQLDNYEVTNSFLNNTYADTSANKGTQNIDVQSCSGISSKIIIRTSGYSNFAGIKVAKGNGAVIALYTVFASNASFNNNPTKQLIIRDTSDMKLYGARCGAGSTTLINIADVRALYTSSSVPAPASKKITGIVISDRIGLNGQAQNLTLQQGNGLPGIIVRFDATHNFNVGDSVDINISGGTIDKFNGVLQVATLSLTTVTRISTGKSITPRTTTTAMLNTNLITWESTLVRLNNVTITGGTAGTWGSNGSTIITDATGTITHFTRTGATFQSTAYPTGLVTSFTGIASKFVSGSSTTNQIGIRNLTDVVAGSVGGTGTILLNEDFESTTANTDIALSGWFNGGEVGTVKYKAASFGGAKYAQISAFATSQATVATWLVTKAINLNATTNEVLTFESKAGFNNGATLKLLVSTNYTGTGNPWATGVTWTDISSSANLSPGLPSGYPTNFTASGNVSLNAYTGTIYIAFKYEGADPTGAGDKTTTWQIDNLKVVGN
ncbi:MAG: choice-of-anchor J domain-containing protein [Deinococcales bacterium]|nr:choice-of-anchor J domain-containing protein [Chitinophagaceae bacterium]